MAQSIKNLTAAILIAISVFLAWTEILPVYMATNSLKATMAEKQELLTLRLEVKERIDQLNGERTSRYAELQRFSLVAPETASLPEIVSTLESIFSKSGHVLYEFTIGKSNDTGRKNKDFSTVSVEASSRGTYDGFIQVLSYIENNIRLFDVKEVSVGEDLSGAPNQLSLKVKGDVYWIKDIEVGTNSRNEVQEEKPRE